MPTKTDKIVSYLPGTFRASERQSALRAFVEAFGAELLRAENSLAEVMQSHWVDHADKGSDDIDDLACLSALFGLAPRAGEGLEEYREHLKRHVRTSIEGTVTVKGILEVTAQILGLHISSSLDAWWNREDDELITVQSRGDDAALAVFGIRSADVRGRSPSCGMITGKVDLKGGVDLRGAQFLCIQIDDGEPVQFDLTAKAKDPALVMPEEIEAALDISGIVARIKGNRLVLASPGTGSESMVQILDISGDASERVLGLEPRIFRGSQEMPAIVTGTADLQKGIDLGLDRFLCLEIDGKEVEEIDCAGGEVGMRTIDEICAAINQATGKLFEKDVALSSGQFITLISPSIGEESHILFRAPSSGGDAALALFGIKSRAFRGESLSRAQIVGRVLDEGIDLRAYRFLKIAVNDGAAGLIDLWEILGGFGHMQSVPLEEIAEAINTSLKKSGLGSDIARAEGGRMILESPVSGSAGSLRLEPFEDVQSRRFVTRAAVTDEAAEAVFGFVAKEARGKKALSARLQGLADLSRGVDLRGGSRLFIRIDDSERLEIDCAGPRPRATRIQEVVDAINSRSESVLQARVADHDGSHLILTSPGSGSHSRIAFEPNNEGDARVALFGSVEDVTVGEEACPAVILGDADISGNLDLSRRGIIRLAVDGRKPVDIDVSGAAPGQTFADEIISAINLALGGDLACETEDGRLEVTSPTSGDESRLSLLPLRYLEIMEYPARTTCIEYSESSSSANGWSVVNDGVTDVYAQVKIEALLGAVNPGFWNRTTGRQLRLLITLEPGESARIWQEPGRGPRAEVITAGGQSRALDAGKIFCGACGRQGDEALQEEQCGESVLLVPKGRSDWLYLESLNMRFDWGRFNQTCFAIPGGVDRTIFDLSRMAPLPSEGQEPLLPITRLASGRGQHVDVKLSFGWAVHRPGSFVVNLPIDLPARFGGRLGEMRLGQGVREGPEVYSESVMEPEGDPAYLVDRINGKVDPGTKSNLVKAGAVSRVPLGWTALDLPFRHPCRLSLGRKDSAARLYLKEAGMKGFIEIEAKEPGSWGNEIAVTARPAGPAMYDVSVIYQGGRFECARRMVLGADGMDVQPCRKAERELETATVSQDGMPALMRDALKPGAFGVLQAKAAGIRADVTRDGT